MDSFIKLKLHTTLFNSGAFEDDFSTLLKFIYSEKTTKFCEISTVDLFYVVPVKSTVEILQNFVAFSECMNFMSKIIKIFARNLRKK